MSVAGVARGVPLASVPRPRPGRALTRPGTMVEVGSLVAGLVAWEVFGRLLGLAWLPPLSACLGELVDMVNQGLILPPLADSVQALALGFVAALASSLVVAFLMAEFDLVDRAIGAYVYAVFLLPAIALVPVFLALFGIGNVTRLAVIFTYCFFYMTINFHTAFVERDHSLLEMADSLQASRWQRTIFVVVPQAMPLVMATIRVGLGRAVKGMINAEQFIAIYGLGGLVATYGGQFAAAKVFAVIIIVVALALVLDVATRLLDQRVTHWAAA